MLTSTVPGKDSLLHYFLTEERAWEFKLEITSIGLKIAFILIEAKDV